MQQRQRQLETPVAQDQWQSYWKELGDQHKKDSIGSNLGRTLFSTHHSSSALDGSTNSSSPQAGSDIALSRSNSNISPTHRSQCHYSDIEQPSLAKTITTNSKGCGTPVPSIPQLTQAQIRATESPLEILTRHILFDDELCVARTGIVFDEIRAACINQIVNVEFQTVNNWIDLNDYSKVGGQYGRERLPGTGMIVAKDVVTCSTPGLVERDDGGIECEGGEGEEGEGEEPGRDVIVANIQTTVCYIPGPEMDPEDAIYDNENDDDEQRPPPSEPQNLVDCHVGLKYFHWQNQVSFRGVLFYREEVVERRREGDGGGGLRNWRQGKFCIVGSFLWQLRSPRTASRLGCGREYQQGEDNMDKDEDEDEKWRCLDLSLVHGIETSLGYFDARARFLIEAEEAYEQQQQQYQQQHLHQKRLEPRQRRIRTKREDYYPVRNGFRLCMAEHEDEQQEEKQFEVEFYSEIKENGQQWVSALIEACRDRPFRPYWLH
ncbi:MAG: hypothetical protein J3R72DRAFT_433795 [Linnemannia gamsii]|nr:MAG: hypothetical protein J3R72DRAFT_433795 [Linnemannia gamsii]